MELVRRTGVDGRDLASTYVLCPLTIVLSQISEYTRENGGDGETRGLRNGCTMVDIRTGPIIHDLFVYVSLGMNVSTKQKDNKTVMGYKKHNNQK